MKPQGSIGEDLAEAGSVDQGQLSPMGGSRQVTKGTGVLDVSCVELMVGTLGKDEMPERMWRQIRVLRTGF